MTCQNMSAENDPVPSTALDLAHRNKLVELLPVIIAIFVFGVVGILGNIVTIRFYALQRRTATVFLIMALAVVDLIVCFLLAPNMAEMIVNVKYTSGAMCKVAHFLGHWFVESSALILGFIALDRYWTICARFKRRITGGVAKRVVIGILRFSCLMSVRDFVNFDVVEVNIASQNESAVIGHYCSNSYDPDLKLSVLIFHGIDTVTFLAILAVIAFTYSNVILTLCKIKDMGKEIPKLRISKKFSMSTDNLHGDGTPNLKTLKRISRSMDNIMDKSTSMIQTVKALANSTDNVKFESNPDRNGNTAAAANEDKTKPLSVPVPIEDDLTTGVSAVSATEDHPHDPAVSHTIEDDLATGVSVISGTHLTTRKRPKRRKRKIRKSELNVTMLMLAVSAAFFLCAAPYFALRIGTRTVQRISDLELALLVQLGFRLCYINSVLNPLIYCLFNPAFRRHVRRVLACNTQHEPVSMTSTSRSADWSNT